MLSPPDEVFYQKVKRAGVRVLMLDYDGTLAPFQVQHARASPYAGVRQALSEIMLTGRTRVVIVSGQACDDLSRLLDITPLPELWASHGWERRSAEGAYMLFPVPDSSKRGLALALHQAVEAGFGARSEVKPAGAALHWRGLSLAKAKSLAEWGRARWGTLAHAHGLELHQFNGGMELRVPGRDKGTAVRAILAESPSNAAVAYLGDDLTDEDAFRALPKDALGVLVRREFRPTAATSWIRPPKELLAFLEQWKRHVA